MAVKRVRMEWNRDEIEKMMRSKALKDELARKARNVARAAGDGYHSGTYQGRDRVRAGVWAGTWGARWAEVKDRALTRAVDAGRG